MIKTKKENGIKLYGVILGIVLFIFQHAVYLLANELAGLIGITPFSPKIDSIDNAFKVVSIFIIPYVWAYVYWAMAPMAVSKCEKRHFWNFVAGYIFALIVGGLILTFAPTYMDRTEEHLFGLGDSFLDKLREFWYSIDGGDMAYNLFPSFHCLNSTIAYLGVARRKEIPKWFRIYSLITTILIYLSTMFVKQHYFLDVVSGISVGAICYFVAVKFNFGRVFEKIIAHFKNKKEKDNNPKA